MAQEYTEYLAINVLNEQQLVSYRSVSRALKVHVNLAKQMLYDFHRKQNTKKPGSVHATYLITGTRHPPPKPSANGGKSHNGGDTVMRSSPPLPSSSAPEPEGPEEDPIPVRSVLLIREEHLEKAKETFEIVTGIHIYSLEANGISDLQILTECNRQIAESYASEDPLLAWKQYGTVQNPNVKRRSGGTAPPPVAPMTKSADAKTKPLPLTTKPTVLEKQALKGDRQTTSSKPTAEPETGNTAAKRGAATKPGGAKRQDSDIFKSFAKGNAKPKKQDSQSSAEATPAAEPEDIAMGGFSDDEPDDATLEVEAEEATAPSGKSKNDRQAELEAMMDQEDEPMEDSQDGAADPPEEDSEPEAAEQEKAEEPKATVTVENGRRRGRRRIIKKRTVKDEEGYLVTKEELAWESFSEDEPAPKKVKMLPTVNQKPGKKGAKAGQGSIMSFFGKK